MLIEKTISLESKRCILRFISESDIPYIYSATRFKGFNDGMAWNPPEDIEELKEPYKNNVLAWENGTAFTFSIDNKSTNEFIGRITIRKQDELGLWDIGYWTHPKQQRKGYMSEVVPIIIDFGFTELEANEITAKYVDWNKASEKVLKNAGMKFWKCIKEGMLKNGNWLEENLMGIKRSEWQAMLRL